MCACVRACVCVYVYKYVCTCGGVERGGVNPATAKHILIYRKHALPDSKPQIIGCSSALARSRHSTTNTPIL